MRRWMSAQRAAASGAARAPGPSAIRMASISAEPFAYALVTCDRQRAAAAERRPEARTSQMTRPTTSRTPSAIKTHPSGVIFPLVAEVLVGEGAGEVAAAVGEGDGD